MSELTPRDRVGSASRVLTMLVTNLTKLAGVYVGLKAVVQPTPNAVVLAFAAFMMAGAQISEGAILALVDRLFGQKENGKR